MKQITAVLLGAGQRGMDSYAPYALKKPHELKFVAVAEPNKFRREKFAELYGIPEENCFDTWEKVLKKPQFADAVIVATQDKMHFQPVMKAIERGYHVLLEKPISVNPEECILIAEQARKYKRIVTVCHVLRYTEFYRCLKNILDSGEIGELVSIQHIENVWYWHMAHSFVRGNWCNKDQSSPMILQKCCHDMDILLWLVGADCKKISSFGSLKYFKKENAPEGVPHRCTDGCPIENKCPYNAMKIYLTGNKGYPVNVITNDVSEEGVIKALQTGPYGRCVFHCDNNVVDHQIVNIEFDNKVTASLTMCGFTKDGGRVTKFMGTLGEINANCDGNEIIITEFASGIQKTYKLPEPTGGHGGGDSGIMNDFIKLISAIGSDYKPQNKTDIEFSVQSHLMAFAAEKSRVEGRTIEISEYK